MFAQCFRTHMHLHVQTCTHTHAHTCTSWRRIVWMPTIIEMQWFLLRGVVCTFVRQSCEHNTLDLYLWSVRKFITEHTHHRPLLFSVPIYVDHDPRFWPRCPDVF